MDARNVLWVASTLRDPNSEGRGVAAAGNRSFYPRSVSKNPTDERSIQKPSLLQNQSRDADACNGGSQFNDPMNTDGFSDNIHREKYKKLNLDKSQRLYKSKASRGFRSVMLSIGEYSFMPLDNQWKAVKPPRPVGNEALSLPTILESPKHRILAQTIPNETSSDRKDAPIHRNFK